MWALALAAVPVVLVVALVWQGTRVPRRHVATVSAALPGAAIETWKIVSDLGAWPMWHAEVQRTERVPQAASETWRLFQRGRALPVRVVERRAPANGAAGVFVTEIADAGLPFGGTWRWEILDTARGVEVTVTEDGFIDSALFRALAHRWLGYTRTAEGMLRALARHRGATVVVKSHVTHPAG